MGLWRALVHENVRVRIGIELIRLRSRIPNSRSRPPRFSAVVLFQSRTPDPRKRRACDVHCDFAKQRALESTHFAGAAQGFQFLPKRVPVFPVACAFGHLLFQERCAIWAISRTERRQGMGGPHQCDGTAAE